MNIYVHFIRGWLYRGWQTVVRKKFSEFAEDNNLTIIKFPHLQYIILLTF